MNTLSYARPGRLLALDWVGIGLILSLMAFSTLIIASASNMNWAIIERHWLHWGVAWIAYAMAHIFKPSDYEKLALPAYALGLVLLIAVIVFGDSSKGAQRWLELGPFRFQPSEIIKLSMPMALAAVIGLSPLPLKGLRVLVPFTMLLIPVALIIKQPDLGTGLMVAASGFWVIYFAGLRWRYWISAGIGLVVAFPFLWWKLHEYQRLRVLTFLYPERDPYGAGYHIIQSKIAIGSGGVFGKGWQSGTQAQYQFLPEQTTDFIFGVLSEEFGLMGAILLLTLYGLLLLRVFFIANQLSRPFERLTVLSIGMTFFIYVFVNIGMCSGILPVVGVPLPLISYGGTALVTLMAGFGIVGAFYRNHLMPYRL